MLKLKQLKEIQGNIAKKSGRCKINVLEEPVNYH